MRAEAEAEVRRVVESTRAPLVDEIKELERVRSFLRDDIELLEQHLAKQRDRLREQMAELQRVLEQPGLLQPEPSPATSGADGLGLLRPDERDGGGRGDAGRPDSGASFAGGAATGATLALPADDDADLGDARDDDFDDDDAGPTSVASAPDHWGALPSFDPAPAIAVDAPPAPARDDDDAGGPPTRPIVALDLDAPREPRHGDAFLEQLRAAVDTDHDPDVDHAMAAFFDQDDDDRRSSRFGRRR
jgi:hypothetical protein